eukprot:6474026-Amphidinium_carterae.1
MAARPRGLSPVTRLWALNERVPQRTCNHNDATPQGWGCVKVALSIPSTTTCSLVTFSLFYTEWLSIRGMLLRFMSSMHGQGSAAVATFFFVIAVHGTPRTFDFREGAPAEQRAKLL